MKHVRSCCDVNRDKENNILLSLNMASTNGDHCVSNGGNHVTNGIAKAKKPRPVLARTWSESYEIQDIEVPGTPKTPRTSTTPGT